MKKCIALNLSDVVIFMLINVIMPTIVGILTFMSRIYFVLSLVEHGKSFITWDLERNYALDSHSGPSFRLSAVNDVTAT